MRTLNPGFKSHAVCFNYVQSHREKGAARAGNTVTGITELSHDLVSHRGVLGAFMAAVPGLCLGPVVR